MVKDEVRRGRRANRPRWGSEGRVVFAVFVCLSASILHKQHRSFFLVRKRETRFWRAKRAIYTRGHVVPLFVIDNPRRKISEAR